MLLERRTVQPHWRLVVAFALLAGCGGVDDDDSADTSADRVITADELEAALLSTDEVGAGWRSEDPQQLDLSTAEDMDGRCPDGSSFPAPSAGVFVDFEPPDEFAHNTISHGLLTFETREELEAWTEALESCVGEDWEESFDPVEYVSVEALDVADHGDDGAGFLFEFAHGEDEAPAHASRWYLVREGDVLVLVSGEDYALNDPADETLLAEVLARAVDKAAATLSS